MDLTLKDQVAAFRYSLIAPIVCRQTPLAPGELKAYLEETSRQLFVILGSTRGRVSMRTLERYLSLYRQGGYDALKPKSKKSEGNTRIPADILQKAVALRRERPERSVEQIVFLLEESGFAPKGSLACSTMARQLRRAGVNRKEILQKSLASGHRRFQAEDVHVIWQSDAQHAVYAIKTTI
ncbi:MAG: hypothetical protein ACYCX4_00245 [Bacillota bacterium]